MCTLQTTFLHDVPANAGLWRPIRFDLGPAGSIVNSAPPAAVCFAHVGTGMRIDKLVRDALTQAMSLSDSAQLRGRVAGQPCAGVVLVTLAGIERSTGRGTVLFPISPTVPLGGPAQTTGDGLDTYSNTCNIGKRMAAVEIDEATTPVTVLWRRVEPDSGGAGITRGGHGMTSALEISGCAEMTGTVSNNCSVVPPRGAGGGMTGACTEFSLLRDTNLEALRASGRAPGPEAVTGRVRDLPQHAHLTVSEGDVFVITNGGGGGLGDPLLRAAGLVAADVAAGLVTVAAAGRLYGVVLGNDGAPDAVETLERRHGLRRERLGAAPARELFPAAEIEVGIGVRATADRWSCGYCGGDLGPLVTNYRDACVARARSATEALAEIGMRARPLRGEQQVTVTENFCPGCGSCVRTDVALAGVPPPPAPVLARAAAMATSGHA
jgi:N-methylhydantoinase B